MKTNEPENRDLPIWVIVVGVMIALGSMLFSRPEAAVEQRPAAETPAATSPVPAGPGVAADARTDDIQMYY